MSNKKIKDTKKEDVKIIFPSIQEKICSKIISIAKRFDNLFLEREPTERELLCLNDEFVQREIEKQKLKLLSELIID